MGFRVPERYRLADVPVPGATAPGCPYGAFAVPSAEPGWRLYVIADDGRAAADTTGWEHVSAHALRGPHSQRTPTWREMSQLRDLFWEADDVVIQIHPARSQHVNIHPHVLHLWRPVGVVLPLPPVRLV